MGLRGKLQTVHIGIARLRYREDQTRSSPIRSGCTANDVGTARLEAAPRVVVQIRPKAGGGHPSECRRRLGRGRYRIGAGRFRPTMSEGRSLKIPFSNIAQANRILRISCKGFQTFHPSVQQVSTQQAVVNDATHTRGKCRVLKSIACAVATTANAPARNFWGAHIGRSNRRHES
jgi:hypothetical protein